jgi:6-phosphogluconolactonase
MRWFLTMVLFLAAVLHLPADTFVYVSMGPEQKIQSYRLDAKDGKLTSVETVSVEGVPGALAVDPQKKFLFASLHSNNTLASFRIDPATGKLKAIGTASLPKGGSAAFVSTDRTGRWLFSAAYGAGKVFVHEIKDGAIQSPAVQTVDTAKAAHSVAVDRDNRFVFVPHVSPNAVFQFRLDAATGKLTEAGKAPGGVEKAGPRHLAFHPTKNFAYTSNESGSSITAYSLDAKEGLKPLQTLSTLPADFKTNNSTADVKVHPNGKFVWVSNRGHDSLAGFAIDADTGKVTALGQAPTEKTPRSFDVEPDGRFVLSAGEGSGKLAVYQVDADTGKLTRLHTVDVGKSVGWVMAVKFGEK